MKHMILYVEDSSPMVKLFKTEAQLGKFIIDLKAKWGDKYCDEHGYWIDYTITGIQGDVLDFYNERVLK